MHACRYASEFLKKEFLKNIGIFALSDFIAHNSTIKCTESPAREETANFLVDADVRAIVVSSLIDFDGKKIHEKTNIEEVLNYIIAFRTSSTQ